MKHPSIDEINERVCAFHKRNPENEDFSQCVCSQRLVYLKGRWEYKRIEVDE